jgi:anti-anti-sigma factor
MHRICIGRDEQLCRPTGDLDWRSSVALRRVMRDTLLPGTAVVIDLGRVRYIDAVGVGTILSILSQARLVGATMELRNIHPPVRWKLKLVGAALPVQRTPIRGGTAAA